jgi:hypothetical protein
MHNENSKQHLQALVQRTQVDAYLKEQLLDDTMSTLRAEGVSVTVGIELKAVANSERVFYLVLPVNPTHLTEIELDRIAAGQIFSIAYDQFSRMVSETFSFSLHENLVDTNL